MRLFASDVGFALRGALLRPGFAVMILLTMAVGIGSTTSVFSVVEAVLLRRLPFPESDRLVVPRTSNRSTPATYNTTYPDFLQWREHGVFEKVAIFASTTVDLTGDGDPTRVAAMIIGDSYFDVVRMKAVTGRVFRPEEHRPGGPQVALLGESLWRNRYGGDANALGRTIRVGGVAHEIVGVVPAEASSPISSGVWLPFQPDLSDPGFVDWDNHAYAAIARLKQGESLRSTNAMLSVLASRAEASHPQLRTGETIVALPLITYITGSNLNSGLWFLLGAVFFVLLLGCLNIANLMLSSASRRTHEFAVRAAMGASRHRLIRQLLTESLTLAAVGAVLGIGVAMALVRTLVSLAPSGIPRLSDTNLNLTVLAFAVGTSFLASVAFGIIPAFRAASVEPVSVIHAGSFRSTSTRQERRGRNLLVVTQLALSLALLAAAGYALLGLHNQQTAPLGFEVENRINVPLKLPQTRYEPGASVARFFERVTQAMAVLPGVKAISIRSAVPLSGGGTYVRRAYLAEGRPEPPQGTEVIGPWTVVGPDHFRTAGIPLLRGRDILPTDDADAPPVMIVNQRFAAEMFGTQDPLGKRVRSWRDENAYREVVGVVGNTRYYGAGDSIWPCAYVPHKQNPWPEMTVVVRTAESPAAALPALRRVISRLDPELIVADATTMEEVLARSLAAPRFVAALLVAFAMMALLQAAIGIYGVLSYVVSLRIREIGIRLAVGAQRRDVLGMILFEITKLTAIGLALGLFGVVAIGRGVEGLLFGVAAVEPAIVIAVSLILSTVALLASLVPAVRAARVDPVSAMRVE